MKRVLLLVVLLLLISGWAHAQARDAFWTRNEDLYYHALESCGGREERVPISSAAALAFAKSACPVCISAEEKTREEEENVRAVSRGGVVVVKFSDAWLDVQDVSQTAVGSLQCDAGQAAWRQLGEYLHGEKYFSFVEAYFARGEAQGRAREPFISTRDAQLMSSRHIADDWYIVVRPEKKFKDSWDMLWRVNSVQLRMDAAGLVHGVEMQSQEENRTLELERLDGEAACFETSTGDFDLQIYSVMDGYVAVLSDPDGATEKMNCARLMIDGAPDLIPLSGYADGEAGVYCCALSEGEVNALKGKTAVQLIYFDALADGYWGMDQGADYAIYSETAGDVAFVVDKVQGCVPVDAFFRCALWQDGGEDRFVLWQDTGALICDYNAKRYAVQDENGESAERVTPLCWKDGRGVFLAESHKYKDYTPQDRLFTDHLEYGLRIGSTDEDEWGSYRCWLADEDGKMLTSSDNRAFCLLESGEILLEAFDGEERLYTPFSD